MSDDLRERTPDEALGNDPAVRGTRSDIGATGAGVTGGAPGMQEAGFQAQWAAGGPTRPDEDGNQSGSGMSSGDGEPGRGAAVDDETQWLRGASADGAMGEGHGNTARDEGIATKGPDGLGAGGGEG
jgi:hypothetical protein